MTHFNHIRDDVNRQSLDASLWESQSILLAVDQAKTVDKSNEVRE